MEEKYYNKRKNKMIKLNNLKVREVEEIKKKIKMIN
jgi:hypothetical protein